MKFFLIREPLPDNKRKARYKANSIKQLIWTKLLKHIDKEYLVLEPGCNLLNFIYYFIVPKGSDDIRVVLNGTSCGINETTWSSNV